MFPWIKSMGKKNWKLNKCFPYLLIWDYKYFFNGNDMFFLDPDSIPSKNSPKKIEVMDLLVELEKWNFAIMCVSVAAFRKHSLKVKGQLSRWGQGRKTAKKWQFWTLSCPGKVELITYFHRVGFEFFQQKKMKHT